MKQVAMWPKNAEHENVKTTNQLMRKSCNCQSSYKLENTYKKMEAKIYITSISKFLLDIAKN